MTIGERIRARRQELGLTVEYVAKQLGRNRATVYRYENNEIKNFPAGFLEPLAAVLKTTPQHLLGWDPRPSIPHTVAENADGSPLSQKESALVNHYRSLRPESQKVIFAVILAWADKEQARQNKILPFPTREEPELVEVPVKGYVAAGAPIDAGEPFAADSVTAEKSIQADYALIVRGDSMEPTIPDGSLVLVQEAKHLLHGQIGVFALDNEYSCKKFVSANGKISLESINPAYAPLPFRRVAEVDIIGRVVGVIP